MRLRTVPIGQPMISAISWYLRPSISFRTRGIRNSDGQSGQGGLNRFLALGPLHRVRGGRLGMFVDGRSAGAFAHRVDRRRLGSGTASLCCGRIQGDAEKPGIKGRIPAESLQLLEGLHKGVLCGVAGIIGRAQDAKQGIAQAILVADHEFPKSLRPACQTLPNELFVVAGHVLARARVAANGEPGAAARRRQTASGPRQRAAPVIVLRAGAPVKPCPSNGDRPARLRQLRIRSQERLTRQPDAEADGEHEHHNADQLRDREGSAELQRLVIAQKLDRETGDRISESGERDHGAIPRAIVEIGIR